MIWMRPWHTFMRTLLRTIKCDHANAPGGYLRGVDQITVISKLATFMQICFHEEILCFCRLRYCICIPCAGYSFSHFTRQYSPNNNLSPARWPNKICRLFQTKAIYQAFWSCNETKIPGGFSAG